MHMQSNTILITGATSGIGLALALEFESLGNTVIICGRRGDRLEKIRRDHPGIETRVCDVSDPSQRVSLAEWTRSHHPELNILVNNAGIQLTADLTKPVDLQRIHAETEINFIAPLHLSSLLAGLLAEKKESAIINISSGLAFVPIAFMPVYCATKAAIHSLSLSLRRQLKDTSVRVFEIIPPSVDTELGHDRRADKSQTHGGMPVAIFIEGAMAAIRSDEWEAAVGQSVGLREKREAMFDFLNR
jgi:uncharacterized oxidoreductase